MKRIFTFSLFSAIYHIVVHATLWIHFIIVINTVDGGIQKPKYIQTPTRPKLNDVENLSIKLKKRSLGFFASKFLMEVLVVDQQALCHHLGFATFKITLSFHHFYTQEIFFTFSLKAKKFMWLQISTSFGKTNFFLLWIQQETTNYFGNKAYWTRVPHITSSMKFSWFFFIEKLLFTNEKKNFDPQWKLLPRENNVEIIGYMLTWI